MSTIAITYPLAMPATPLPQSAEIALEYMTGMAQSPFSAAQQTHDWLGRQWISQVVLPPMLSRATADPWLSFFSKLRGRRGWFTMIGDWARLAPRGTATAASVNGASQTGNGLVVNGMGNAKTLLEGDLFQLESRLYRIVVDATSDASGNATLQFEPDLRSAPANTAALTLTSAKGLWRVDQNSVPHKLDTALFHGLAFTAIEKL